MTDIIEIQDLQLSKEKNTNAFLNLRGQLFDFIKSRVPNEEDAEDLIQDVFLTLESTVEPIQQIRAWLYRVSRNKIIDRYRKKTPQSFSQTGDLIGEIRGAQRLPDDEMMDELVWQSIQNGLQELPKAQREVFEMHEFEGLSFKAISAITGDAVNTLILRKHYAVKQLRKKLKNVYSELKN
ncbi:MAG: RNA polymerase sigma factor [Cyclobacteriaceae bacterium]|nr:RNA polymerase sigma factor [Cyclobacteriaceae bacterium HetDA_MAG_MS6]